MKTPRVYGEHTNTEPSLLTTFDTNTDKMLKSAGILNTMIAIIEVGGKQQLVSPNTKITTDKVSAAAGESFSVDKILLIADENGSALQIGTPTVSATVGATVLRQLRTRKIMVRKFKNKVRYRRTAGHRQHKSDLKIESIA